MKVCRRCQQSKSLDAFTTYPRSRDGLYYCCRECHNASRRVGANRPRVRGRTRTVSQKPVEYGYSRIIAVKNASPHLKLAAAILAVAVRDARDGDAEAAAWLAE